MFKCNNSIVPNKVHIGWHFSSNNKSKECGYIHSKICYDYA